MPYFLHTHLMSLLTSAVYGSITKGRLLPSSGGESWVSSSCWGGRAAESPVVEAPDQTPFDMGWMVGVQVVVSMSGLPVDSDVQTAIFHPPEKGVQEWKHSIFLYLTMQQVSSTYLFQRRGFTGAVSRTSSFEELRVEVGHHSGHR